MNEKRRDAGGENDGEGGDGGVFVFFSGCVIGKEKEAPTFGRWYTFLREMIELIFEKRRHLFVRKGNGEYVCASSNSSPPFPPSPLYSRRPLFV